MQRMIGIVVVLSIFCVMPLTAEGGAKADFDGDGKADITVFRPSDGKWFILKSSTNFTAWNVYQWGISTDIPVPGDYDGDGKADVTVFRPSTGTWFILKSSTNFTAWSVYQWGISADIPVPGDYDGDSKADVTVFRPSTGTWFILKSSTNFTAWSVYQWGISTDVPVPGDYDGDGKADVTVFRPSTGTWFILKSSTNFTAWSVYQWGISTDIPVPGDYDGDSKADVTVFRPSTGTWFILKSSTNFTTWSVYQWGISTDIPAPGDYDGDGKTDVTVFRPSTGIWFILKSSTNFTAWSVHQWGTSGDTPVFEGPPAIPILDQSNTTFLTFGGDGAPGSSVTQSQTVAQTFTVGTSGLLRWIDLGIYKDIGAIGDVTLDILPFSVFPDFDLSASLYSTTIPIASIPLLTTTLTSVDVSAANLAVSSGEQLAIVLRRSAGPATSPWVVWQDSDFASPYLGGSFFVFQPGFTEWLSVSGDHRFQTWVNPQ